MTGIERMRRMYEGRPDGVPVSLDFCTPYMCKHAGIPDCRFLFGQHEHRVKAHVAVTRMHDLDGMHLWIRGKRKDWLRDYPLVENDGPPYIRDNLADRRLELSEGGYAIDFPERPPYRRPYIEYGESQILINGVPTYSKPKLDIRSKEDVDRLLPFEPAEDVKDGGMFDGVKLIADAIGDRTFLEVGCNSSFRFALGWLGLQEGLIFMREEPDVFAYLVDHTLRQELEYYKVCVEYGIHAGWITDIWVDLVSLADYQRFIMPCAKAYFRTSRELGVRSHYWPTGHSHHLIDLVNEMKPDALHLEEYVELDIAEIRRRLDPDILLYGNLDALDVVQKGPVSRIKDEVKRQIDACLTGGSFVVALGSEVTKDTPPRHVDAVVQAARGYAG